MFTKKAKGGIFCHASKINIGIQFNPAVTLGTQKWTGNTPNFMNRLTTKIMLDIHETVGSIKSKTPPNINKPLPSAWIQKYLITDSFLREWNLESFSMRGIAPKNLSSIPTQQMTQLVDEILTKGPSNKTKKNNKFPEDIK